MLNIQFIRDNPDKVKQNVLNRGFDPQKADVDRLLELDKERGEMQIKIDTLRARRNELSKSMQQVQGKPPQEVIEEGKNIKARLSELEDVMNKIQEEWNLIMSWMPNMAYSDVPVGKDASGNIEIKAWIPAKGYLPESELSEAEGSAKLMPEMGSNNDGQFQLQPHWEIGEKLDMLDLQTGANVSGSRFYYLKKDGYMIMYAIFDLLLKKLLQEGFDPMYVPVLVREKALFGTSHFPADADQVYEIDTKYVEDKNRLFLVGSSEPSLFAYYMDKLVASLPVKMVAQTDCFRSEAGSWGKDVRGMKRVHQFEKMEMDMIIEPSEQKAREIQEYLLGLNEWLLQQLELPYHVINMCTGDLGYAAAAKKYDVEVWLPQQKSYMEVMSDSITTDFQARRLNIKYQDDKGNKNYAYTVNDTGATQRLLIAIIEHYQQQDGTIKVPKVLQPLLGKEYIGK
jgi:seryl-tRNA synthetase